VSSNQSVELSETDSNSTISSEPTISSYQNSGIYLSYIIGSQGNQTISSETTVDPLISKFQVDETAYHPSAENANVLNSNNLAVQSPNSSVSGPSGTSSSNQSSEYSIKMVGTPTVVPHVSSLTPSNPSYKESLANSSQVSHTSTSNVHANGLSDGDVNLVVQHMSAFGSKDLGVSIDSFAHAGSSTTATNLIASAGHH